MTGGGDGEEGGVENGEMDAVTDALKDQQLEDGAQGTNAGMAIVQ